MRSKFLFAATMPATTAFLPAMSHAQVPGLGNIVIAQMMDDDKGMIGGSMQGQSMQNQAMGTERQGMGGSNMHATPTAGTGDLGGAR